MQQSLCPEYPADSAWYEVLALETDADEVSSFKPVGNLGECKSMKMTRVAETPSYEEASQAARTHAVGYNSEVWVVDRNDEDRIALRVTPQEYTARGLLRQELAAR